MFPVSLLIGLHFVFSFLFSLCRLAMLDRIRYYFLVLLFHLKSALILRLFLVVFLGTIMENLKLGCPSATDEEVIKAAKLALADEVRLTIFSLVQKKPGIFH